MKRWGRWRFVVNPVIAFVGVYILERTGFRRYGADAPAIPADEINWGTVLLLTAIVTVGLFLIDGAKALLRRSQGPETSDHA